MTAPVSRTTQLLIDALIAANKDGDTTEVAAILYALDKVAEKEAADAAAAPLAHTVRGESSSEGWAYGVTHDADCPGCAGTDFTSSPRSESYWAS